MFAKYASVAFLHRQITHSLFAVTVALLFYLLKRIFTQLCAPIKAHAAMLGRKIE
jgi:membrane-bound metal-dependent hydrolase YbcI (DUF457 family)